MSLVLLFRRKEDYHKSEASLEYRVTIMSSKPVYIKKTLVSKTQNQINIGSLRQVDFYEFQVSLVYIT